MGEPFTPPKGPPGGMNVMQGFGPQDMPSKPEEFVEAAKVLEWAAAHDKEWCDGSDMPEFEADHLKRVAKILTIMATAFAQQERAAQEFMEAKAKGMAKPL